MISQFIAKYIRQRGGVIGNIVNKLTGRGSFEVDESFVMNNLEGLSSEEKELMSRFVEQSISGADEDGGNQDGSASAAGDDIVKVKGYYRICDSPRKTCDDSPLESFEFPERSDVPNKLEREVFGHEGQMIHTDGNGRSTKLTKVYKRGDNRGKLLGALRRMKINEE